MKLKITVLFTGLIAGLLAWEHSHQSLFEMTQRDLAASKQSLGAQHLSYKNWGISNALKTDIGATEAWKVANGTHSIIVGVIDTGLDAQHPDLRSNVWTDSISVNLKKSAPSAPSAVYGWNFITNTPNPTDDHGHGTHVAGIIGAVANPKEGVAGVAKKVQLLSAKYYSEKNSGDVNLRNTIKAIEYAIDKGARIINYSGGGPEFSEEEYLAIKRAEAKGVLFVAAAGNEKQNTDLIANYYYPSAYGLSNIISVAATDIHGQLFRSSNWGKRKVDVAAPGENIYSTLPGGKYGYMSGTSQATAFVTGLAALLLSKNPQLTPAQLKTLIIQNVDPLQSLKEKVSSGGKVNAYRALLALQATDSKANPVRVARSPGQSLAPLFSSP